MKNWLIAVAVLVMVSFASLPLSAIAENNMGDGDAFGCVIGYKALALPKVTFQHDTKLPDDYFLPRSNVPGSAGTTTIGGGISSYFALGLRCQKPVANSFMLNADLGMLVGGQRDEHKNDNDSRPDANGSFVYSESRWGGFGELGLSYYIVNDFYIGVEAELVGIYQSNGWYRWGSDESEHSGIEWYPSIGPKIGLKTLENCRLEGSVQFGKVQAFSITLAVMF